MGPPKPLRRALVRSPGGDRHSGKGQGNGRAGRACVGFRDIGPILDPRLPQTAKCLILLARPTGIEPVFPP